MRRDELTDAQWKLIEPVLPKQNRGGRWNDHRTTLNGMLWVLRCGTPWRDMPERYGSWKTVYSRFRRWTDDGTLDKILTKLRARIDRDGLIDWDTWCVDGSNVRASKAAAGAARTSKKTGRKSPPTTPSDAPEADSGPSCIWFVVGTESPSE
jgi:transposase